MNFLRNLRFIVGLTLPPSEIELEPRRGQKVMVVDFCVNDRNLETDRYDYFNWYGLKLFHYRSGFGDSALKGSRRR